MLSDLITSANSSGFLISNLFQLSDGSWQANLRTETYVTEFGRGFTPEEALSDAIDRIETKLPFVQPISTGPAPDLLSLIGAKPFKRRF